LIPVLFDAVLLSLLPSSSSLCLWFVQFSASC
jgi:hypothetical protein